MRIVCYQMLFIDTIAMVGPSRAKLLRRKVGLVIRRWRGIAVSIGEGQGLGCLLDDEWENENWITADGV
jgi:hypothetical protein